MFERVEIAGYRGLESFSMTQLGRVNLIVGANSSGKTSVLEAIGFLASEGALIEIWRSLHRRLETFDDNEVDVRHLFSGHTLDPRSANFELRAARVGGQTESAVVSIERPGDVQSVLGPLGSPSPVALRSVWTGATRTEARAPLTHRGGVPERMLSFDAVRPEARMQLVPSGAMDVGAVVTLLEATLLGPEEDRLVEALQTIEPGIERVAPIDAGAIGVRINGNRIPLGSLGDGAWRILGIALALVQSPHGVLLVDEIDTGLHHTVMEKMWHLVYETAKRLDVQVFATTHSWDCVEALASIARGDGHDVTMQRIERGKSTAIAYDEPMIRAAASRRIEVR